MNDLILKALPRVSWCERVVYQFAGTLSEEPNLPFDLRWEQASLELIDSVMGDAGPRRYALKRLLEQGAHGVIIHNGHHWAAHGFFSPPGVVLPEHMPKSLVEESWWFFYMHTHPNWRRRGLQKACIRLGIRLIFEMGGRLDQVKSDTNISNVPSRKAFLRTGFKPAGMIRTLELRIPKLGTRRLYTKWNPDEPHKEIPK